MTSWDFEGEQREGGYAVSFVESTPSLAPLHQPLFSDSLYGAFVVNPADVGSVKSSSASRFISLRCHLSVGLMVP